MGAILPPFFAAEVFFAPHFAMLEENFQTKKFFSTIFRKPKI